MREVLLATAASLFSVASVPVWAQSNAPEVGNADDIIVTATRQSTLLSKTPIAMSAVTGTALRDAGIIDARALTNAVPNISVTEGGQITIRGVTNSDGTEKGDPSAAFLLDGIYIARSDDVLGAFYDVERVEVLRGPQGTLYGRNTTAGVINVISARPTNAFAASLDGRYGSLDMIGLTGMVNVPVGDTLGVRAAVNYDRRNSYLLKGVPSNISLNPNRDMLSARLSFGGTLGDNFTFVVRGDFTQAKGAQTNSVPTRVFFPGGVTVGVDPIYVGGSSKYLRTLPYAQQFPNNRDDKLYGIMGEFTYDFGPVQLTYLGSYRETKRRNHQNLFFFDALNNPATFHGDYEQNSHELRAAFGAGNPLHGQAGIYYFKEKVSLELNLGNPTASFVVPGAIGFAFVRGPVVARSEAAFGQLTYDIMPDLHVTGGIRYTKDFKSRDGATVTDFPNTASIPTFLLPQCTGLRCVLSQDLAARNFKKTTWKFGIDYDAPGLGLFYASVSSGYKAGGFNDGCVIGAGLGCGLNASQLYYNPETLTAYEAGFKVKVIENALRLNVSAFHYDYSSLQLTQGAVVGGVPQALTQNAGSAKVDGVEFEALMTPSDNDRVELSFNYLDARYTNFTPTLGDGVSRNFKGLRLDRSPKYTAVAGYTHTFQIGDGGKVDAAVRTHLSAEYYLSDLAALVQYRQPSFTKTDVTLTYTAPEGRWYVQGFAKNLENEITLEVARSGIADLATIGEPRTYGIRTGIKF